MKIRPGIVTAREMAKNQRRFPMMANTGAGLSPHPAARRGPPGRGELLLAHAEPVRLARPAPADDPAQDRAGDDDRAEHRDEDADDQDEGEAADDRRAEGVQDRRRDET